MTGGVGVAEEERVGRRDSLSLIDRDLEIVSESPDAETVLDIAIDSDAVTTGVLVPVFDSETEALVDIASDSDALAMVDRLLLCEFVSDCECVPETDTVTADNDADAVSA